MQGVQLVELVDYMIKENMYKKDNSNDRLQSLVYKVTNNKSAYDE